MGSVEPTGHDRAMSDKKTTEGDRIMARMLGGPLIAVTPERSVAILNEEIAAIHAAGAAAERARIVAAARLVADREEASRQGDPGDDADLVLSRFADDIEAGRL